MSLDSLRVAPLPQRPSSSLSRRSVSRTSQRPTSRLSQRSTSKQPRLVALLNTLVKQITGLTAEHDSEDIHGAVDVASRRLDQMNQASVPDLTQIDTHIQGHVEKARINIQDTLADLLQIKYSSLKRLVAQHKYLETELKLVTLPHHLQFLLLLSSTPTAVTLSHAEEISARDHQPVHGSQPLTWRQILQEEPFEGQHWQGAFGLPDGSIVEAWDEDTDDSDVSSFTESQVYSECTAMSAEFEDLRPLAQGLETSPEISNSKYRGREAVERLQAKQYWRTEWHTDSDLNREFNLGDASTLGPATRRVLSPGAALFTEEPCINEIDAVREMLMILKGHQSVLFHVGSGEEVQAVTVLNKRRIVHLTPTSQASILADFTSRASTLQSLRYFVSKTLKNTTFSSSSTTMPCHTFEALSEAIDRQLSIFDRWCAEQEERISISQRGGSSSYSVVSLLSLEKQVDVRMSGTFHTLQSIVRILESSREKLAPATLSAMVLNLLMEEVRRHSDIRDTKTAQPLMDVWRESAEPLWTNIGRWLKDGIPIRAGFEGETYTTQPTWDEKEFFIRTNPLIDIGSPDFWESGYTMLPSHHTSIFRNFGGEGTGESGLPAFLHHVSEDLLAAGKAIGLLRALGVIHLIGEDWLEEWSTFGKVTEKLSLRGLDEALESLVLDALSASCWRAQYCFRQVLVEQCNLWRHVHNLEQVYLMMRGDAMSQFGEKLFTRMDARQPWNDFHFLNTAFRDITKFGLDSWINPSLVRISHRGTQNRSITRTVRAIDGLFIEYAVPFPLTYLFGPDTNIGYSSIFNFLLQIKRSKGVLDRILIRGLTSGALEYGISDMKPFYALRSKLSWFVNTFLNFIMTNVIHVGLIKFHEALRKAASLDEMILVHSSHLERLLGRCLLQDNTSALHRAILSILDIGLHFSDCLTAFAGDTSLDVSRRSLLVMRHRHLRKSRRGRVHKPDVIGFADDLPLSDGATDSEEEDLDDAVEPSISASGVSLSFAEESFFARLGRMNIEFDGLVRFIRHGVESLAGVQEEAAATFGILAFSLQDPGL